MAATTTKSIACPAHVWTLLADGSAVASCQLQAEGTIDIAVAASAPAASATDCITLWNWPPLALTLATGDKVYGRSAGSLPSAVRAILTATA